VKPGCKPKVEITKLLEEKYRKISSILGAGKGFLVRRQKIITIKEKSQLDFIKATIFCS
jgi:hypothetical protein